MVGFVGLALTPVAGCRGHNGKIRRMNWVGGTRYAEQQGWLTARSPMSVGRESFWVFGFPALSVEMCLLMMFMIKKRKIWIFLSLDQAQYAFAQ